MSVAPSVTAQRLPLALDRIGERPFLHFVRDGFLPPDRYQALCADFPAAAWFPERIEGDKQRLNSRTAPDVFAAFLRESPRWRELFDQLSAPEFVAGLYTIVRPALRRARGPFGARPWRLEDAETGPAFARRVRITFEFSRMEAGAEVPPHTDATEKLVSLLLYFPPPDWREEWGGGTVLYRPRDPALARNWHNRRVPFEALEPFFDAGFAPNRLFGFVKSHDSYHGMPPLRCPAGVARTSLNVNVYEAARSRPGALARLRTRAAQRLERRRHGW